MDIRRCPDKVLAANRNPNEIATAVYDNNSINTNTGTNGKGVPDGTNKTKNTALFKNNPNIVNPIHKTTDIPIM
ncbi:hypothetical protein KL916_005441 (mitochondrion) [Ogataea parapolymorpha]|nr:hypothetical protein KL916_005441 [Ogataea parapolymorpha]